MNPSESSFSGPRPVIMISGYRGLAEYFLKTCIENNFRCSVLVRKESALESLREKYPTVFFMGGEVHNVEQVKQWVHETRERFGQIDALINNAAVAGPGGKLEKIDMDAFETSLEVNLLAPIRLAKLVIEDLKKSKVGVLINLSGGGATDARPHFAAYATAKCGLVRFTECLAKEYPELGIYALSPGALATNMMKEIAALDASLIGDESATAKKYVEQGAETPQKAADLALFLIQNKPENLRGCVISAIWDEYQNKPPYPAKVGWWTLRRVDEVCLKNLNSL